ncbi:MAG: 50S ribosomal protein L2 [Candidatus Hecatellales archaeon B24]|nr:MAG: 50S ribosomal protein L2 [Candidatus Hecatellales archaeon B24]
MGKRIRAQRRGKGTPVFRAPTHKRVSPARYPPPEVLKGKLKGVVRALIHDLGRGTPLALIECDGGLAFYTVAAEGIHVGQEIEIGPEAPLKLGNMVPVSVLPEGFTVCNVEKNPGDGGKFARASGSYATVVAKTPAGVILRLSSGKTTLVNSEALATVGIVAGFGRTEKPFMKAGEKYHLMRAKGRKWPVTRGVAMIAAAHPHGGGRHRHLGKPGTISRRAPPGRKVGLIAAKQSGRSKRSRGGR